MTQNDAVSSLLNDRKRILMVGIGGTTMSALALMLHDRGYMIAGSDMNCCVATDRLAARGIQVFFGHRAENIKDAECIIRTIATRDDNPEVIAAKAAGLPILDCSQVLNAVAQEFKNMIYIESNVLKRNSMAAMITHIFMEAQRDPTVMIKECMALLNGYYRSGNGDTLIIESSAWRHDPNPGSRVVVLNAPDDEEASRDRGTLQNTASATPDQYTSYGFDPNNDVFPTNIDSKWHSFNIMCGGALFCHVDLKVYGKKNVLSALAAAAVAWRMDIPADIVAQGLANYPGTAGCFEQKGVCHGADVFDDSSYHPAMIKALLNEVREMGYNRIIVAIQPQFLIRTKDYIPKLTDALDGADYVVVTETYGIRGLGLNDTLSTDLTTSLPNAVFLKDQTEVADHLVSIAMPGDVILTVGAGDIYKVGETICSQDAG